ncbi:histidinol-phosphate transaminase [Bacillus canaveralius]|uniref:Histidinol-phosphate aminotransferase n=1 Tax=Bacillus canaveralius TaxID=1403243 RepID=A0A2N5GRT7_9BACI|nr:MULTISPECIES: histidinol-phosphate transaminase [Bacillus]PLR82655.1 histidinol-phosphate transaminase [Bacillus sp. V33-4]PLR86144.1 histidinol-phosphate transaminase [Bacillus canaveralius]PLS00264.1 histidinol-phosphate transaminase [Bacillus canaveralius]
MRWKQQLLTLNPYQPGKSIDEVKKQYRLKEIVKLASNENPYGCSERVLGTLEQSTGFFALYPDGYATNLRETLATHLDVFPNQIIFGNGSDEIIQIISRSLLHPGANTVMAAPTFPQYKHNAIIEGAEVREIPLKNGNHDLDEMLAAIDGQTNAVWLCSPNNPTGTYIPEDQLIAFLDRVPKDVLVVLDEAYFEYVVADDYYDSVELLTRYENLIVLRTFSKIYGLASLRIGYGIASQAIIRAIEPAREPFNVNRFALLAAEAALGDQAYVNECRQKNRQGLDQFYRYCDINNLDYYPSQGNFILIDFQVDGNEVFQFLLEKGFIVRSGPALGFPTSIRVTVGSREQNEKLLGAISEFLAAKAALS